MLNALKAVAFLNLAVFYFLYNINVAQGANPAWDYAWWQRLTLWSIVVLCGMTFSQGSNYLKWGLGLLGVGTAISLCTYIFTPQHPIYFGIFTFLGLAYLVVQPIHWWLQKSPGSCGWLLSAIAYDLTRHLTDGVIIWQGKIIGHLPSFLYGDWNVWLGLPSADFVSLEYVPFLPNIFANLPLGRLWGSLFFLFMCFAAISTVLATFENIMACCIDLFGWSRKKAALINCIAMLILATPCALGFNLWSGFMPFGEGSNVLSLEDFVLSNVLLPIGALCFVLFSTLKKAWGWDNFVAEANSGKGMKVKKWMKGYMCYVLPLIIIALFVTGILTFFKVI